MSEGITDALKPLSRPRLYEQVAQQIIEWATAVPLGPGDRLPAERELAARLNVSRATVSQALVALEVVGFITVRHGDGSILNFDEGSGRVVEALRAHAKRIPEVIEARDAMETKLAQLAAQRRTDEDLRAIDAALDAMEADIDGGGRGVQGDADFHDAVTRAAHSPLLARLMREISDLVLETRIESLSQPDRPHVSLRAHRRIAAAIARQDGEGAAAAMHDHVEKVSDVAIVRDQAPPERGA